MVLEVNERGKTFYKTLRDLVERMYRHSFHLQYKNQSSGSKNQILSKLQDEFLENWLMRHVRILIVKTYKKEEEGMKSNIPLNVFLELYVYITRKKSFINITFVIFTFHISI